MALREGTILENRYRIDGLMAQGGMGALYKAFDTNLNNPVAIKENNLKSAEHIEQFKQEALILARLRHAGLPKVIQHFRVGGQQYLVMDFIEGQNLWEIVTERGEPLPVSQALDYMSQVCQAVSYLHSQLPPVIHRDIKPQNIKVTPAGRAVLVDFGIAKEILGDLHQTHAGARRVSSGFSPPEQYTGVGTTPASDVYALGATLYAILTAKKPPRSTNLIDGEANFDPPNLLNPSLNPQVTQTIMHAMQLKPEDRPETVGLWQQRLETILAAISTSTIVDDSTIFSQRNITSDEPIDIDATVVGDLLVNQLDTTQYWLVDEQGQGYALGFDPLLIGRSVEADITLEDLAVSREHAQIRVEEQRCLVLDKNSANGTFINDEPVADDWQPLNQGDKLTVGLAQFYLTDTQPAKAASSKLMTEAVSVEANSTAPPEIQTANTDAKSEKEANEASQPSPEPEGLLKQYSWLLWPAIALLFLLLCSGVALGGFFWFTSDSATDQAASERAITNQPDAQTLGEFAPLTDQTNTDNQATAEATADPTADPNVVAATTPASIPEQELPVATPSPTNAEVGLSDETDLSEVVTRTDTILLPQSVSTATVAADDELPPTVEVEPVETDEAAPAEVESIDTEPTAIPIDAVETLDQIGNREVIDVDFNPQNPNELYAVVKGVGIYKSISGENGPWLKLNVDGSGLTGLTIDPTNPMRLYAPGWNAVLKSTDGGNTWEVKSNGLSSANRVVNELVVHPIRPDTLFGGIGETLVVSTDGGETWVSDGYGRDLGGSQLNKIVIDPFDSETVYVAATAGSLFKSTDGGRNFIGMPFNVGEGAFALAAHPTQPNVYLAGMNATHSAIAKSTDGFEFRSVSDGLVYGGADSIYSTIAYAPSSPNIIYAGSGYESNPMAKGLFKSTDDGETWFTINSNIALNPDTGYPYYVKTIIVHPANPDMVLAATGTGLYLSNDGGANWQLL